MSEEILSDISKKLNALISISLRQLQLFGNTEFGEKGRRRAGTGDVVRYLADLGLDSKDIAEILGAPVQSVRTLLTPARRK
jgi:hypothetical protein